MELRRCFLLVEGDDDKRFVERVFVPRMEAAYSDIRLIQYAQKKTQKVCGIIRVARDMNAALWVFGDKDHFPCFSSKKSNLCSCFPELNPTEVLIVEREIESWFVASVERTMKDTRAIGKEEFHRMLPRGKTAFEYKTDLLNTYNLDAASVRNQSLGYCLRRIRAVLQGCTI